MAKKVRRKEPKKKKKEKKKQSAMVKKSRKSRSYHNDVRKRRENVMRCAQSPAPSLHALTNRNRIAPKTDGNGPRMSLVL